MMIPSAGAQFTAPEMDVDTVLTFELTVTDNEGLSDTDSVSITVLANQAPLADAGQDQSVNEGLVVNLDGNGDPATLTVRSPLMHGPRSADPV